MLEMKTVYQHYCMYNWWG